MADGELSAYWYYEFRMGGKRYRGSTFTQNKSEAVEFEINRKIVIREAIDIESKPEKYKKSSLIQFREKITDQISGDSLNLEDVWETVVKEGPAVMRKIPSKKGWSAKEAYWNDFLAFLKTKHPQIKTLREVTNEQTKEYASHLKTSGKFQKIIQCKGGQYTNKITQLAPSTINEYIKQLKQIFNITAAKAGLLENPFNNIPLVQNKKKSREIFEIDELEMIKKYLDDKKSNWQNLSVSEKYDLGITEALFIIGINTGLRRADICLLKWENVNFTRKVITMETQKTNEQVSIP